MRILLVDDDAGVIEFYTHAAQAHGQHQLEVAGSAEEALTQVIRQSSDLIFLDIRLPGASGLEILSLLRSLNPHAVIAIISGFIPEQVNDQVATCADVMIEKPVSLDTLNQLFDRTVAISEAMEEIRLLGRDPLVPR
jgi:CheY-like chemotaxis protein